MAKREALGVVAVSPRVAGEPLANPVKGVTRNRSARPAKFLLGVQGIGKAEVATVQQNSGCPAPST